MNLLVIIFLIIAVLGLLVFRVKSHNNASDFLEKISLFEFLLNKGKLHWLYSRIKSSKSRFIQLGLPGQTAIILKEPDDVKVIVLRDNSHRNEY